ncbi:MAG TPA: GAF domain-containing protein [Ktedonobacteraceae bacterium]|nr:GAF domain-containing protein [Ktedonobacteraceae bacterium]
MRTPSLDETTKHMLLAVQETNAGLWDWNLVTNEFYLSPHWKEMLGFGDAELPNSYEAWRERVHPEDLPVALLALQRHFDGSTPFYQVEYRLRHKDGSYRWFFLHGSSLRDASGPPLRAFGWHTDITERKQEEAQRVRWLALRAEVSQALTERSSLPTVLQRCCRALEVHLRVAWAFIWLAEEAEMTLDLWASNTCDPALLDEQYCDPAFALTLGHIAWRSQPYLTNDVPNDPYLGTTDWIERERISAFAGYPLLVEERVVGVMALFSRERFSTETLELLALLANAVAQGIGRKWAEEALEARVQQQTRELELLLEISHAAPSTRNLSALLDSLLVQLKTVVDYSGAALYCIQDDQLSLLAQQYPPVVPLSGTHWSAYRDFAGNSFTQVYRLIVQEALPAAPSELREPIIINDLHTDPRFVQLYLRVLEHAPAMAWQFHSWMLVPLLVQEQGLAILTLNHSQPHAYTPQHARFAFALATQAAFFALEYPRLSIQAHTYASFLERIHQVRELHEAVAIHLSTIQTCTQQIREALLNNPTAAMAPLRTTQLLTKMGLADLQALDVELQPELLETEGLIVVLKRYLAAIRLRRNVPVEERLGTEPGLPVKSKYALYRIVQQALCQFSSHALASAITLRLEQEEQTVVLELHAEGPGFDEHDFWLSRPGLQTIRKYAEQLNAQLSIDRAPESGTTLSVRFPLPG